MSFGVIVCCSRVLFPRFCRLTTMLVGQGSSLCKAGCISRNNWYMEL